jgi:5'-3' exonuclease
MIALIDGDIVAYRCSASAENEPEDIALLRIESMMRDILHETESDQYKCFLTGKNNFRYDIYPDYKANRRDKPKPIHLQACRTYLLDTWKSEMSEGCEADDLIGIEATASDDMMSYIICSIDKDLKQIPGYHWNFVTKEKVFVSPLDGLKSFYKQLILGDVSDNIPGYDGKARQKWPKFMQHHHDYIDQCYDDLDMYDYVRNIYTNEAQNIILNGRLLFIQRKENQMWTPPNLQVEVREEGAGDPTTVSDVRTGQAEVHSTSSDPNVHPGLEGKR